MMHVKESKDVIFILNKTALSGSNILEMFSEGVGGFKPRPGYELS
jgi:hypothetical protein